MSGLEWMRHQREFDQYTIHGYDTTYRYGQNPEIDEAVSYFNQITMQYDNTWIACLDTDGNRVSKYTNSVVLQISVKVSQETEVELRKRLDLVLNLMKNK